VAQIDHLDIALDPHPQTLELLIQEPLGLVLRQGEHERILRVKPPEADMHRAPGPTVDRHPVDPQAEVEELFDQPQLVEGLKRSSPQADRPGLRRSGRLLVQDPDLDASPRELDREQHAGRPGTHDHNRGVRCPSGGGT
jgi:hypothetical protein